MKSRMIKPSGMRLYIIGCGGDRSRGNKSTVDEIGNALGSSVGTERFQMTVGVGRSPSWRASSSQEIITAGMESYRTGWLGEMNQPVAHHAPSITPHPITTFLVDI